MRSLQWPLVLINTYDAEESFKCIIFIPNFVKIGELFHNMKKWYIQTHTNTEKKVILQEYLPFVVKENILKK